MNPIKPDENQLVLEIKLVLFLCSNKQEDGI